MIANNATWRSRYTKSRVYQDFTVIILRKDASIQKNKRSKKLSIL